MYLPLLNFITVFLYAIKIMYFLRNYEQTRKFVELIVACINDSKLFIFFLIGWVIIFSLCQVMLGTDFSRENYQYMPFYFTVLISVWIDSIGEFDPPNYKIWS